ncbi:uncharacterized protein [Diabrotica undecimpunctata]|uniref:uncharacterized protein n=1 Tax=Diabrotica undecimpunctata TaxID=50387 RepID=UPI003B631F16
MAFCDARTSYLFNAYIYSGRGSDGKELSIDEKHLSVLTQAVLQLCKPIYGSNRNITTDNWFSSIQVVDKLLEKKLTYVGMLKKNKREIPIEFLPSKNRAENSSLYGFTSNKILLSYVPKKNKAVIMISSMHRNKATDADTGKEEIISFANSTKDEVDSLDQKCATFSTSRRTRRWPMAIFLHLLNISSVNSCFIYMHKK